MKNHLPLCASLTVTLLGCATSHPVGVTASGAPIVEITLRQSNVYLIESRRPVLVDTGTLGDMDDFEHALAEIGMRPVDIALAIVTHAHHDHAGLAKELQSAYGVKIMLGAGDVDQAERGEDDTLKPQNATGVFLKPLLSKIFPEFSPDIVVKGPVDLAPWGIGGTVMPMPGHTAGSIVVLVSNASGQKTAFVGDQMLGGFFGGAIFPTHPGEHYYQADAAQNRRNIDQLLALGVHTFYLGHGGPVEHDDVARAFDSR